MEDEPFPCLEASRLQTDVIAGLWVPVFCRVHGNVGQRFREKHFELSAFAREPFSTNSPLHIRKLGVVTVTFGTIGVLIPQPHIGFGVGGHGEYGCILIGR